MLRMLTVNKKNLDRLTASVSESCENGHFIYLNSSVKLAEKQHAGLAFLFIFVFISNILSTILTS